MFRLNRAAKRGLALVLLAAIVVLAFAIRLYALDSVSLRGDESFTVLFVQKPFAQMWEEIRTVEPNPPLLYLLLRGWLALAGTGEFAARFFSVFWGVLCVPLIYRLAREIFELGSAQARRARPGARLALAAAFLTAINPYQVWHSQDVRNYTLWPALSLLALVCFWQWRNRIKFEKAAPLWGRTSLVTFVLAELLALYAHYYEAFILLAINLYMLWFILRRRGDLVRRGLDPRSPLVQWVSAQIALAVLYLPFPLILSNRVSAYGEGSGRQGVALWDIWQQTFSSFTLGETLPAVWREWGWIPLAVGVAAGFILLARSERRGLFFLLYAGAPTLAVFALNVFRPLYLERYLNGIAPAYYLLLAYTVNFARVRFGRVIPLALFGLLALLSAFALGNYFFDPAYAKAPDWRALARAIRADSRPADVILQNFPETSLVYYTQGQLPLLVYPEEFLGTERTIPALNNLNYKYRRIWFVPAAKDFWDPTQFVETFLDRHDDIAREQAVGTFRLELYETPAAFLKEMQPSGAVFGKWVRLLGYRAARDASVMRLRLYWQTVKPASENFQISIRERNSRTGDVLASISRPPLSGTWPTSEWRKDELVVDAYEFTPNPNADILEVGMSDATGAHPLPVTTLAGQPQGDWLSIPLSSSQ